MPTGSQRVNIGKAPDFSDGLVPITLFVLESAMDASHKNLRSTVASWLQADDVFNEDFLRHVYLLFLPKTRDFDLYDLTISLPEEWTTQSVQAAAVISKRFQVGYRGGPYFVSNVGIDVGPKVGTNVAFRQAWRLFDDTKQAFQFPVVPDEHREHTCVILNLSNMRLLPCSALLITSL